MRLESLGWNSLYQSQVTQFERENYVPARVSEEQKNYFRLLSEPGEYIAEVSGKLRYGAEDRDGLPTVGDWVLAHVRPHEGRATIHRILPRRSKLSRKTAGDKTSEQIVAANVDTVFLMSSLNRELNLRRIERYLTVAWESGARPVILLNKADLCDDPEREVLRVEAVANGVPIHVISALTRRGMEALDSYLGPAQTVALLGSSGVGKSTAVNSLIGEDLQRVREIREDDDRGKHTTSCRQLIVLPQGGLLIDTPGMRELQLWESKSGLQRTFQDIDSLAGQCRFRDCRHETEPGCAVSGALEGGRLESERFESFRKLERELAYLARKQDTLAMLAEKKRWKQIHKQHRRRPHHKPT